MRCWTELLLSKGNHVLRTFTGTLPASTTAISSLVDAIMPHCAPSLSSTSSLPHQRHASSLARSLPASRLDFQPFGGLNGQSSRQSHPFRVLHCSARSSSSSSSDSGESSSAGHGRRASGGRRGNAWKGGLQAIKGVGPRYENLLMQRGLTCVEKLQDQLHLNFSGDKDRLQKYLQEEVGIKNSQHCAWMVEHLGGLEWVAPRSRVTLAVEGNIGAGKSTFLSMLSSDSMRDMLSMGAADTMELRDVVQVVHEPVDEWQTAKGKDPQGRERTFNLLEKFYSDPQRYAFTFQNYVLMSRIRRERDTRATSSAPLRVLERSIFSDRMVFVRAMHEAGRMEDWELGLYDSWFNVEMQHDRQLAPNGFIYLRANPDTCMKRMRRRARSEETGVEPAYLEQLHRHHEEWLMSPRDAPGVVGRGGAEVGLEMGFRRTPEGLIQGTSELSRVANPSLEQESAVLAAAGGTGGLRLYHPSEPQSRLLPRHLQHVLGPHGQPDSIRDKVVFLHAKGSDDLQPLGNVLNGTPALILDHDHDSLEDLDAQRWQAKQVADFFSYVQRLKNVRESVHASPSAGAVPTAAALWAHVEMLKHQMMRNNESTIENQQRAFAKMDELVAQAVLAEQAR